MNLELNEFDISIFKTIDINNHKLNFVIDTNNFKCSSLVCDYLSNFQHISNGIIMTNSEQNVQFYKKHINNACIYSEYNSTIIENALKQQQKLVRLNKNNYKLVPYTFIVLDNCLYENWYQDKILRRLCYNCRGLAINVMIIIPPLYKIPPGIRENIDNLFINSETDLHTLQEKYNIHEYEKICVENYDYLVINMHINKTSKNTQDHAWLYNVQSYNH